MEHMSPDQIIIESARRVQRHFDLAQRFFADTLMESGINVLRTFRSVRPQMMEIHDVLNNPVLHKALEAPEVSAMADRERAHAEALREAVALEKGVSRALRFSEESFRRRGLVMFGFVQDAENFDQVTSRAERFQKLLATLSINPARERRKIDLHFEACSYRQHLEDVFANQRAIAHVRMKNAPGVYASPYASLCASYGGLFAPFDDAATVDALFEQVTQQRHAQLELQSITVPNLPEISFETGQQIIDRLNRHFGIDLDQVRLAKGLPSMAMGGRENAVAIVRFEPDPLTLIETYVHEALGHILYRNNLPDDSDHPLFGMINGFQVDETLALWCERTWLRDPNVLAEVAKLVSDIIPLNPEDLAVRVQLIQPVPKDRTSADNLSYMIKELIRGRAERDIINGDMEVRDLPARLEQDYLHAFGLEICGFDMLRQTFQWPLCLQGHTASYPQGMVLAAQMDKVIRADLSADAYSDLSGGADCPALSWLRDAIHSKGKTLPPDVMMAAALGGPLDIACYLEQINVAADKKRALHLSEAPAREL